MRLDIGGARDIDQNEVADLAGYQAGVVERPDTQNAVDAVLDQIHSAVGDTEIDVEYADGVRGTPAALER